MVLWGWDCSDREIISSTDAGAPSTDGLNTLYIGHSFGRVFAQRLPAFAEKVGVENHTQRIVFSGGASGAPLALWQDDTDRTDAQAILDGGDVDLLVMICCSQGWIETAEDPGIINWMDYALERNPGHSLRIGYALDRLSGEYDDAASYVALWEMGYAQWQQTAEALRSAYPGVEIFTIPHEGRPVN